MAIVVLQKEQTPTKDQIAQAREEYNTYIKVTADIRQNIVAIGGEYHADAERMLLSQYGSKNSDIWGGGYDIENKVFETNALINLKPILSSRDPNILNPKVKRTFLSLIRNTLKEIDSLL